ncbi:hypothetical protein [Sphingomonas sp. LM7]|uniref:hypothetical protein n=1 Tax=Sphingomonas sp. LM7 TaxID=1938607 RepID=UPI000983EEC4|nr:hypothetical protein [Sphingomonas sp. LM7]AQR74255.1 hypothetical protein BXU08_11865 [Sphingomonas sp. LM7]
MTGSISSADTPPARTPPARHARRIRFGIFAILAAFLLVNSCLGPTYQVSTLRAVKAESRQLAATYPIDPVRGWTIVPKRDWPTAIASLEPEFVVVDRRAVTITTVPFFDGGWGYEIVERKDELGMLPGCYSEPYPGVFWHGPC